jgi:hypothetical protein
MSKKKARTHREALTQHEVKTFIESMKNTVSQPELELALISLLTGRVIRTLLDPRTTIYLNVELKYSLLLNANIVKPLNPLEQKRYCKNVRATEARFALPIPYSLGKRLTEIRSSFGIDTNNGQSHENYETLLSVIHQQISLINKAHKIKLSLGKLASHLDGLAPKYNISKAEVFHLRDLKLKSHAGSSYLHFDSKQLYGKYFNFLKEECSLDENFGSIPSLDEMPLPYFGSPRCPKIYSVLRVFTGIRNEIDKLMKGNKSPNLGNQNFADIHNLFTAYTINLLNLSSGHRPVNNPYRTLDNILLDSAVINIEDKVVDTRRPNRFIPLIPIAKRQISNYLSYLQWLEEHAYLVNRQLSVYAKNTLASHSPLFFALEQNIGEQASVLEISKSTLVKINDEFSTIPANWHRHYLRTLFTDLELQINVIDAFMGHEDSSDPSFSVNSTLTFNDLRDLSHVIQKHMVNQLNIHNFSLFGETNV